VQSALRSAGVQPDDTAWSLETLARAQGTTPATLFAAFPQPPQADAGTIARPADPLEIEARLTGTEAGGKTLAQLAEADGLDPGSCLERLAAAGIEARQDGLLKAVAERYGTRPI
jgi:hypothetical protein